MDASLPLSFLDDSELFKALKSGKLKSPNALAYDAQSWVDLSKNILNSTERDKDILYSALHFGIEFKSLRLLLNDFFPKLAIADAIDFVVAGLNVQAQAVMLRTNQQLRRRSRFSDVVYMGDSGDIRIQNSGRQNLNPDDVMAILVDGMANLLYHVSASDRTTSNLDRDRALLNAQQITAIVSIEHGLKELWERVVWEGCKVRIHNDPLMFLAGDELFAKLWLAWQRRFETIVLQEGRLIAGEAFVRGNQASPQPVIAQTVLGIEKRPGRKREYIVGRARIGKMEQLSALGAIESTYLKSFLDEVIPKYSTTGLTYRDIWQAWWVFQDLVGIHQGAMPKRGFRAWKEVGRCALQFSVSRAAEAIAKSLGITPANVEIIMEIFTIDPDMTNRETTHDLFKYGAWGRPILRRRKEDCARIVLASVVSPNPVMMMERWMTRTGMIEDSKKSKQKTVRGKLFEKVAREKIHAALSKNRHLTDFGIAHLSFQGKGSEEIDALLKIGSTVAVCEIKCWNVPFEPVDRYNHLGKIEDAVDQVKRKVEWSRVNSGFIFDALSIPKGDRDRKWNFISILILNTPFGSGLKIDGCAVTDLDWISTFLGDHKVVFGGTFLRGHGASLQSRAIYRDQVDLEQRFLEIAVSPPSLASELGRIEWEMVPFPTRSGLPIQLQVPVSKGMPTL